MPGDIFRRVHLIEIKASSESSTCSEMLIMWETRSEEQRAHRIDVETQEKEYRKKRVTANAHSEKF